MAAVEPVLQVEPCLANDVISANEVVVHHHDTQLCLQWERYGEFKHPERQSQTDSWTVIGGWTGTGGTNGYSLSERGV